MTTASAEATWLDRLRKNAEQQPDAAAITHAVQVTRHAAPRYSHISFAELHAWSQALAEGFAAHGIRPGTKTIVLVKPGPELYAVLFGLAKAAAVPVIIDPGMGLRPMLRCLSAVHAEAFVGIPAAQVIRVLSGSRFSDVRTFVTVGRRWFWGGATLTELGRVPSGPEPGPRGQAAGELAMISFTTGSTGPAKAVELTHGNLEAMLDRTTTITAFAGAQTALVTLPLFGMLRLLLGTTVVLPPLIPGRVGATDPAHVVDAVTTFGVDSLFASPAVLGPLLSHCRARRISLPSLRWVLSGGAPVPVPVLTGLREILSPHAQVHAGYGATEVLPISSIESREFAVAGAFQGTVGRGVCVGHPVDGLAVRLIKVVDEPIRRWNHTQQPPDGIGEIVVAGPNVSGRYHWPPEANLIGKISDGEVIWHRTGDVARCDEQGRIWFCGRKSQRVVTRFGTLYPVQVEEIFNAVDGVARTALVGVGARPRQRPVVCVELSPGADEDAVLQALRVRGATFPLTERIDVFLVHPRFPVDVRHNAKIGRERLATWADQRLRERNPSVALLQTIPVLGWLFLIYGGIRAASGRPLRQPGLRAAWWVDAFLSVIVHAAQVPAAIRASQGDRSRAVTVLLTMIFGMTWWKTKKSIR